MCRFFCVHFWIFLNFANNFSAPLESDESQLKRINFFFSQQVRKSQQLSVNGELIWVGLAAGRIDPNHDFDRLRLRRNFRQVVSHKY
ncbi:MAG: hypothetical protein COA47_12245 [Robiginitomaculum sp.]|nr:MAG: hypothetical protein COA47_12245 [Robiginitomaculum sp.]